MRSRLTGVWAVVLMLGGISPLHGQGASDTPVLLSLSANDQTRPQVRQGWPLILIADVMNRPTPDGSSSSVTISAGESWANAIRISISDGGGEPVSWPFHLAHSPVGELILDGEAAMELAWWLTPDETSTIAPGVYTIDGFIDSTAILPPFTGLEPVFSVPVVLTFLPPNATPSLAEIAEQRLLLADYHVLRGEDAEALSEMDLLLAEQPGNVVALTYKARLLRLGGQLNRSLESFAAAVEAFGAAFGDTPEPPFDLYAEYVEVQAELENRKTFEVSVSAKSPLHPYYGQGFDSGFKINGIEGGELWLLQDTTYTFTMVDVPPDVPFYFSTSPVGAGAASYEDGVVGQPASGNDAVTLTPSPATPGVLYYQSSAQPSMGWRIHIIRDAATVAIDNPPVTIPVEYYLTSAYPNPFTEETHLTLTVARAQHVAVKVFNVQGQEVAVLFDGNLPTGSSKEFALSGSRLAAGVYFVRVYGDRFSATRTVTFVR